MSKRAPKTDDHDEHLKVGHAKEWAAGVPAVVKSLKMSDDQMGVTRTALTLLKLNQVKGFDCPGCAWPEPDPEHRHIAEFCENGAKAVAEEATLRRVTPEFFAEHPIEDLLARTDYWLGQQGRLTDPMWKRAGSDHYEADRLGSTRCDIIASRLRDLDSPDRAAFYTSGRTSNEAAFLYQLLVRRFGTNNLPDCSNMCHESSRLRADCRPSASARDRCCSTTSTHADLIVIAGRIPARTIRGC